MAHVVDLRRRELAGARDAAVGHLGRQPGSLQRARREQPPHAHEAFGEAGWRTVADVPSDTRDWPEGTSFYHYDQIYDRRNLGYRGPKYGFASMPDQYVLLALQRLELAKPNRRPIFSEIDLVSSHTPWTRIPPLIAWGRVGDGSIFNRLPIDRSGLTRQQAGVLAVDQVHASHAVLVRRALRQQEHRARSCWATTSRRESFPGARVTTCRSRSSPTTRRCCSRSPAGAGRTGCAPSDGTGLADERLPQPLPQRVRLAAGRERPGQCVVPTPGAGGRACARPGAPSSPGNGRSLRIRARRSAPARPPSRHRSGAAGPCPGCC